MSDRKEIKKVYKILLKILVLVMIALLSSVPVFRGRMFDTGESLLWCFRLARLFPATLVEPTCLAAIIFLRLAFVLSSYLFFYILNSTNGGDFLDTISGVILLSFSPYQLYIAFDKTDITDMILWILILLFASVTVSIAKAIKEKKSVRIISLVSIDLLILCGVVISYFLSHVSESVLSFKESGYAFGEMFTSFFYRENHPGLGIALLLAVFLWLYYIVINSRKESEKKAEAVFFILAVSFMVLSSLHFPWNVIIRMVPFLEKIINKIESPTIFLGISYFCFSVPAVRGLSYSRKVKNEYVGKVLCFLVLFLAVVIGVFLNSQYMSLQHPLGFETINQ